ncbi:MAG TPA: UvrD-helicase domain-containing protein [Caldimonas sp.]|nr:UvrD-helicase domain-containing protein [Caldimonas sp.]HEX4235097.1 UvrD-helicase domain-containing protein [Caldimonas sp.]
MTAPAFLIDGAPAGREAFYAIACDPARSCAVEACAGSGKTWMLVSRMLRALLEGVEPHEILAITFTRAAAGEMRQRLSDWLTELSTPRSSHAQRVQALVARGVAPRRAEELAPALGELQGRVLAAARPVEVRTFHAWFAQLLRAAPLALLDRLGLAPEMELIEELEDHRPAVMRAFHAAVLASPALRTDYATMTVRRGRTQLRRWLEAAWWRRIEIELADEAGVLEASVERAAAIWPEMARFAHPIDALRDVFWQTRLRHVREVLGRGAPTAQEAAAKVEVALASSDPRRMFDAAWRALYTKDDEPRNLSKATVSLADTQTALGLLRQQIEQEDACIEHGCMVRLSRALLVAFAGYKRSRGYADMADLERCALALLRDDELAGWVQERLDARIRHVLIDEFQDTSPLQWHALQSWLSGYAGAGGGASGQRPPGVFLVGDPKQSIYRFRGAEPRVFAAATRFVRDAFEGNALACDHTRRNAPAVIAAINGVFGAAAMEGVFEGFRLHTTEVSSSAAGDGVETLPRSPRDRRAERPDPKATPIWRDTLTTPRLEPEVVLREREAAKVARRIAELLASGSQASELFVLCRKRETLRLVATALECEQIAHSAVEDTTLASTPEAQDLIAVLDAIVSPAHRLSLARALRSPLFGASDQDLLDLSAAAQTAGDRDWWRALAAMARPSAVLARARELLHRWRAAAATLPPHDLLDRIVHEGALRERTIAVVPQEQRALALDAIDAVLAEALLLDGGRYATPYGFIRALKRRAVKSSPPVRADAVALLTVHGAKGLEADTVFITDSDPERPGTETATLLVDWPIDAERPSRCAFLYSDANARCPFSLRDLLAAESAADAREELNALYVAMTRARHRLVVSATEPFLAPLVASWWQRLLPLATDAGGGDDAAAAPIIVSGAPRPALLKELPRRSLRPATAAPIPRAAPVAPAASMAGPSQLALPFADEPRSNAESRTIGSPGLAQDPAAAALGSAMHRVLEWATADDGGGAQLDALAQAAAREFAVAAESVRRHAAAILGHPDAERFFAGPRIVWSGNEVSVSDGGEVVRIDRLVQLQEADGRAWWVLDYKLHHAPEGLEPYRAQLLRYRAVVARAQPGETVRCAFVTGEGRVVEVA